jgi:hypothetical protein
VWVRSCDITALQLDLLKKKSDLEMDGRACVFKDIECRLAPETRVWLESMQPSDGASAAEAEAAHDGMRQMLNTYSHQAYPLNGMCYCLQHERPCVVYPLFAVAAARQQAALVAQSRIIRVFGGTHASRSLERLHYAR